jgi:hypothetical protein
MKLNTVQLIKYCGTRTVPAVETKSIGLRADPAFGEGRHAGALFFALHRDYFIVTRNFTAIYRDLVPSRQITVTHNLLPFTGTGKKQCTATQTATN